MLTGPDAADLGVKVMYNMPVPTTLNFWKRAVDVLKAYKKGWDGGAIADKFQKTINLSKVKSEMGYSASDYFSMIYELITNRSDVNLDDLSGTELEAAETALFKEAIAEAIRVTMWCGDTSRESGFNSFDGFLKRIKADIGTGEDDVKSIACPSMATPDAAEAVLKTCWTMRPSCSNSSKTRVTSFIWSLRTFTRTTRNHSTPWCWNRPMPPSKTDAPA
ncbi:MAG: hypothetical protein ACLR1G_11515 [Alistipes indistinctus]